MHKISEEEIVKRIGEVNYNKKGYKMTIIDYKLHNDITVKFENGYVTKTTYGKFKEGKIKNKLAPSNFGVGIVGDICLDSLEKECSAWRTMLQRCYSKKHKISYPTYTDVTCCDEWLYLPNFIEWLHSQENWEVISKLKWQVDKDIIERNNKIYCPDKCCLVTNNINSLFVKKDANRGKYPIGVHLHKQNNSFSCCCRNPYGKDIMHHGFKTAEEAFYQYKKDKEMIIKEVAKKEYDNGVITKKCYEAMMNYEVLITD